MTSMRAPSQLWKPSRDAIDGARMTRFMRWAAERRGIRLDDYSALWKWSVHEPEQFWADVWDFCGVRASRPYEQVLASREMPGARWFEGARLNYAENMLLRDRDPDSIALLHCSELRPLAQMTWGELSQEVARVAGGLRSLGVVRGDRVVAYMPNIPETLIAFLSCASIGAVWSSAAPEFGARSVIDRFSQIEPKVLLCCDGYRHGGKDFDRSEALATILEGLPSVRHTVTLPYLDESADAGGLQGGLSWAQLLELDGGAELSFEQVPFDHPLWVLYSSGTTGLPKAIVHGHGGILIEQLKKSLLHMDLKKGDRAFWFTTTGWMMWNFLAGCLLSEASIVLYDGSPAYPDMNFLWQLAEQTQMTCMGVSAGLLTSCQKAGIEPGRDFDLSALRAIGSTGSPLPPEGFRWCYEHVKDDVWLFSTSGGTDVCTAFVGGAPILPVYEGELQCRALGCAVEAWDETGEALVDEVGELVLTEPMPSMPLYLWGDEHGERYRESYFNLYPGIWRHGDWIRITPRGGAVIYGRSDSTVNRQGVRMGTSEIYRATGAIDEVLDALVVDIPKDGTDELTMFLFVVLRESVTLDYALGERIKRQIREDCSPRHVPNEVVQVKELPRTLSGKLLEVPVKRILMGATPEQAASIESLANPAALDWFVQLAQVMRASGTSHL